MDNQSVENSTAKSGMQTDQAIGNCYFLVQSGLNRLINKLSADCDLIILQPYFNFQIGIELNRTKKDCAGQVIVYNL